MGTLQAERRLRLFNQADVATHFQEFENFLRKILAHGTQALLRFTCVLESISR